MKTAIAIILLILTLGFFIVAATAGVNSPWLYVGLGGFSLACLVMTAVFIVWGEKNK